MSFLLQSSEIPGYKSLPLVQALNGYPVEQKPVAAAAEVASGVFTCASAYIMCVLCVYAYPGIRCTIWVVGIM